MPWPISPSRFLPETRPAEALDLDEAWYFIMVGDEIVSIAEHGIPRPVTADEFRWLDMEVEFKHYMGQLDGRACFALSASGQVPEGYAASGLRAWLGRVEAEMFALAGRAKQLVEWNRDHSYCGRCGSEMQDHAVDRAKHCTKCGLISYPRLSPSIIVLVRKGEEMLLARNAAWPEGMFSTLAGFVEPGESIEQTVHREVMEEVGLEVTNLRYMGSQSWPFPNSLMLGFHADYLSGEIVCQDDEIAEARWFHVRDMPNIPGGTAISRWLIDAFVEEHAKPPSKG